MNWLAHVFLSEDDIDHRLGNLLADLVRGPDREAMSAAFRRGAARHHAIDSYTDAHPVVRRSRARLGPAHRRFSGVLVDVFYDYFLATAWERYSRIPFDDFTADFYSRSRSRLDALPAGARGALERIIRHDLLGSYREIAGVERSLQRISSYLASRWRREFALERAVHELRAHERDLSNDFSEFFPQLRTHVAALSQADER